jgi:hypothetical protein
LADVCSQADTSDSCIDPPHPHRQLIDAAVDSRASDTMLWSGKLLDVTEILILYLIIGAF